MSNNMITLSRADFRRWRADCGACGIVYEQSWDQDEGAYNLVSAWALDHVDLCDRGGDDIEEIDIPSRKFTLDAGAYHATLRRLEREMNARRKS